MAPPPCSSIPGNTARVARSVVKKFILSAHSNSASSMARNPSVRSRTPPTLLTRTSTRPCPSTAARTSFSGPSGAPRSACTAVTPSMACRLSTVLAPATTRAPSSASVFATARPMPLLAPVTTATLSDSSRSIATSPGPSGRLSQRAVRFLGCGGRPAREEVEVLRGRRAGFGGIGEHRQAVIGRDLHRLVGELEVADDRVVQALDACVVEANVVRRPLGAERLALRRELSDELGQAAVVRVATGFGAQDRDQLIGHVVPIEVEVLGAGVEEREPGGIGGPTRRDVDRVERVAERVGGHDVQVAVADEGGRCRHGVQDAPHARSDSLPRGPAATRRWGWLGRASEIEEVRALGLVERERARNRLEHGLRDAAQVPALHAGVVVDADPGKERYLLAAQSRDPPVVAIGRESDLVGRDAGPPGGEELADLATRVHRTSVRQRRRRWGDWEYLDQQGLSSGVSRVLLSGSESS